MSGQHNAVRNIATTIATQLCSWAISLLVTMYLPHAVGPAGLGTLQTATSFVAIVGCLSSLGTSTVMIQGIAGDRSRTSSLLAASIALRIPLSIGAGLLAWLCSVVTGQTAAVQQLVIVVSCGLLLSTLNDGFNAAMQGREKIGRANVIALIEKFLASFLVLAWIFLLKRPPLWSIPVTGIFTSCLTFGIFISVFRSELSRMRLPNKAAVISLAMAGLPFVGIYLIRTTYNQVDPILIGHFVKGQLGLTMVGWYGVPNRLLGSALFIPVAVATTLLPTLTRIYAESPDKYRSVLRRCLSLVIVTSVPIALPLALVPGKILFDLLPYSRSEYANSAPIFAIYGFGLFLWSVTQITGTGLLVLKMQNSMLRISISALVLTVICCCIGIPLANHYLHNAGVGAACADVAVEVFMVSAFAYKLPANTFDGSATSTLLKGLLAAVPMAALLMLAHGRLLVIGALLLGAVVYAALCFVMRIIGRDDIQLLRDAVSKRKPAESA